MTPSPKHPRGEFVWHELLTSDPEAALDFYCELVGWDHEIWEGKPTEEGEEQDLPVFTLDDEPVAGALLIPEDARQEGAVPHWLAYLASPNVDATTGRATKLGATLLVPPNDIPEIGRFAVLEDPQGATFAALTLLDPGEASESPRIGEFSWHELGTRDAEGALAFYGTLFGWHQIDALDMGQAGIYHLYGRAGSEEPMGGIYEQSGNRPGTPHWNLYIRIPDAVAAARTVEELGGEVLQEPTEVPGGDLVLACLDPQGAAFFLHQVRSS